MKNNLENSIKQSLENFEMPYNDKAWAALNERLDANSSASSESGDGSSLENAIKSSLENHELPYNPAAWTALKGALDVGAAASVGVGIEEAIKTSLENHELPYNPKAWNSLESKLNTPKGNGLMKWYIAAGILAVTATTSYFMFVNDHAENKSTKQTSQTQVDKNSNNSVATDQNTNTEIETSNNVSNTTGFNATIEDNSNTSSNTTIEPGENDLAVNAVNNPNQYQDENNGSNERGQSEGSESSVNSNVNALTENKEIHFIIPVINEACQGQSVRIKNDNDYPLTIVFPNGSVWTGKANTSTNLNPSQAGLYKVGYMKDGELVEKGVFNVMDAPSADFEFVDLNEKYLNGLPTTEVKTTSLGIQHEWKYNNRSSFGQEAQPHFFHRGEHEIELIVTGSNGCKTTVTKSVTIDEDYNLMAMNAFDPNSIDPKVNTFIPFALVERNVKFTMIIIDVNDGHLIYETTDASKGWDGIDRQTGSMVSFESSYIWKVTIENPAPGEKSDYAGTVIPVKRN